MKRNLKIYQGDDYVHEIEYQEDGVTVDVSDRTFKSQIKIDYDSEPIVEFTVDDDDAADGVLRFILSSEQTTSLDEGVYVYDVQTVKENVTFTFLAGRVVVVPEVTK